MDTAAILRSDFPDVEVGGIAIHDFVLERAAALGDKPAVVDAASGRALSYRELAAAVERVAAGLAALGFRPGDVLAISSPNLPEFPVAVYGATAAGGVVTTVNPLFTADELSGQLADAGARVLVTVAPFLDRALAAADKAGVERVFVIGATAEALAGTPAAPFSELTGHDLEPAGVPVDPDGDLAAMLYSSGTTGLPKGVELTHASVVTNARQNQAAMGFREDDVVLAVAPLFHAMGFNLLLPCTLRAGATLVTMPRFDLEGFLDAIQRHRVTVTIVVPPVILALAHHPLVDRYDLSSLRVVGSGAAPLGADTERRCAERLGCVVCQGYGMTEHCSAMAISPLDAPRRGTVGRLLPNVEARIVDPASGTDLGPGEVGELWVRGPQAMRGYHRRPQATAEMIGPDGWLRTGDLCSVDADGHLTVVDRIKELIKYNGYQVAPAELEHLLQAHPAVADAAVVRRPDAQAGEIPVAYASLRAEATPEELMAYVAERVAPYKRVRAVEFVDEIPRSPSGKLLRRVLVDAERTRAASSEPSTDAKGGTT
jgi:acyl-CoA synthetase (AMP-forming)/AMP-acid ligase II